MTDSYNSQLAIEKQGWASRANCVATIPCTVQHASPISGLEVVVVGGRCIRQIENRSHSEHRDSLIRQKNVSLQDIIRSEVLRVVRCRVFNQDQGNLRFKTMRLYASACWGFLCGSSFRLGIIRIPYFRDHSITYSWNELKTQTRLN